MRLLLDEHLAGHSIGDPLRKTGHDVLSIQERPELRALDDDSVLKLATNEGRIVVTKNIMDFMELVRVWMEEGQSHSGCLGLAISLRSHGDVLDAIARAFEVQPSQDEWVNLAMIVGSNGL